MEKLRQKIGNGIHEKKTKKEEEYQPSSEGDSLTACNAAWPAKSKMAARGPQNGRRGLEWCLPLGFWAF